MDDIYANVECGKPGQSRPSPSQTVPRSSERRFHGAVVLSLSLLSLLLLAGLIGLSVHHYNSVQLSAAEANLTERFQASDDKLFSLTEERDLLVANLTEMTKELNRLQKTFCPAGWRRFSHACYFLSCNTGSWEKGREDCRAKEADLVIIDSLEEQTFLSKLIKEETLAWIGLTDKASEGTWIWIDGTPLSLQYWRETQPDNGGGHQSLGEEDCGQIILGTNDLTNWNDLPCKNDVKWICEINDYIRKCPIPTNHG
ncbi:CD209 antigen-like protein E isoform X2 [Seriola aureovittata]|uniref:CD209 antigen-like protein E isoform X2 n=1 Tax=Seriola aureovittata TaxID=2871759 RepID=UPI0024BEF2C0|nr:CD209 antigen-like protein E isoform X2 [Seriola aureovittata]